MKLWINAGAVAAIAVLLSTAAITAPNAVADGEQMTQLLDHLGVQALLEQAPTVLAVAMDAEARSHDAKPQEAGWQRELDTQLRPQTLSREVARFLDARYRDHADALQQVQQRLQAPLAERVRYFDLAMMQSGADNNLRDFLSQHGLAQHQVQSGRTESDSTGSAVAPDTGIRRALLREIDAATASSLLTATLQSAIAARVRQAAGAERIDPAELQAEIAERQRYLAPLSVDYLLYDYRYLREDELREYRDLIRDPAVQEVLDSCRQGVLKAIVGELKPPPNPRR